MKIIDLFGNDAVKQNEGVKYSKLLEQFLGPFMRRFTNDENIEDIIDFASSAWNFGNLKDMLPEDAFDSVMDMLRQNEEIDERLFHEMVDYKISNFGEYDRFIVDFELDEPKEGNFPILRVLTKEKNAYLMELGDNLEKAELENDRKENDFEENYINRHALILKPQQPFVDWCFSLYPDLPVEERLEFEEEIKNIVNIYLIEENEDVEKWLIKKFDKFFMMLLDGWSENKKEWPQNRSYKMFTSWFRVDISKDVFDTVRKPIQKAGIDE